MRLSLKFRQSAPRAHTTQFQEASLKKLVCLVLLDSIARFVHVTCVVGRGQGGWSSLIYVSYPKKKKKKLFLIWPG